MGSNRQSILVVDDTPANLRLLTGILSEKEYMVRPVPHGKLAISAAKAEPPDLILLDIMMPDMNGYEVCEVLKNDDSTRDIPVIFLSAKAEVEDKVKAFEMGGQDYITKPFQAREVIARVETHLKLRRLQQQFEERNQVLSDILEQLRETQDQLIHREKMAALGQLIAGVAHEINTPLGVIKASIANVSHGVGRFIESLPKLFDTMKPDQWPQFINLIKKASEPFVPISSREARAKRKKIQQELAEKNTPNPEILANLIVDTGIHEGYTRFSKLIETDENRVFFETAYQLFMQRNNTNNIETAVEKATKVVFALKRFSHFDDSGRKIEACIREGIEDVLTLYYNQIKKGIEVETHFGDVPNILCYPDELNQVWTNLIHNAIQAMDGKGKLEIWVERDQPSNSVKVKVGDSGCGIPDEVREKIFDPFITTKPAGEGTGLGLNIVKRIIKRHGGTIEFETRPGRTVFSVFLPLSSDAS